MSTGIAGQPAPEFRFDEWLANVDPAVGLAIADVTEPVIYLYNFQAWCPGCHSHGFPTMKTVRDHFEQTGESDKVKFIAVQTVFEGFESNTPEAAVEALERHGLSDIALGHDSGTQPTVMQDYRTGGTPWTVIIGPGPSRIVLADGFQADAETAIGIIDQQLLEASKTTPADPAKTPTQNTEEAMTTPTTPKTSELRDRLTVEQYEVTQNGGTERAFTGAYHDTKTPGVYRCVVCNDELFDSAAKFDSGTGWPSFDAEITAGRVTRVVDTNHGMTRTEARCANCDAHLGHVFPDGPESTGERYCMNSASLNLEEAADLGN